jgi:hypothetical protein
LNALGRESINDLRRDDVLMSESFVRRSTRAVATR